MSVATAPTRTRRVGFWIVLVAVLVVVGSVGAMLASAVQWTSRDRFDPESAGPGGTRALARILDGHGVDVTVVRNASAAADALATGPATLVLPDAPELSDAQFTALTDAATDLVVIEPRSRSIRLLFDGRVAGFGEAVPVAPACDLGDAQRAGAIVVGATFTGDASGCYPAGDGYGLLWTAHDEGRAVAVDGTDLFTNERLTDDGNAALAVNLLGARERLVWFVPTLADSDGAGAATLGELTPDWVSPAIVLALVAAVAAALWRGRRFGPLVRERLPVTVRGSETTRGRAHLYARSRDVAHAAAALRADTAQRLRRMLALPVTLGDDALADAVAARLDEDRAAVRGILIDDAVRDERRLVALSHRLHDLENALASAARPGKESR